MATKSYARRSTHKQAQSLRGQVLYLLDFVKDLRKKDSTVEPLTMENTFIETKSGKDDEDTPKDRPVFKKFMESLVRGDLAVFPHNDRCSRNTIVVLQTVHELARRGVVVRFGNLPIDVTTPEGELMLTNFAAFSRYFLEDLKRKTRIGLMGAQDEGKRSGPPPPWFEEVDENGQRIMRPTKLAFEIERSYQLYGPKKCAARYLPTMGRKSGTRKLLRFMSSVREWHKTADPNVAAKPKQWTRLRAEDREKRPKDNIEGELAAVRKIFAEA